jgi:hypothetical protein
MVMVPFWGDIHWWRAHVLRNFVEVDFSHYVY